MIRWTAVLVALVAVPAAASDLVYTKQPRFRIPYHSDPAELQRLGAREIQLFVSTDRGANWRLAQSVPPTAGRFAYEAPTDGEYWFSVRTLDGLGRLHPQAGGIVPGLKVAVDSRAPELALSLERTGAQVRLAWRANDLNLDPGTLRLEFRQPGFDDWQAVQVVTQASGQTAWTAPATGTVSVRGTINDRAGNIGTGSAELQVGAAGYAPLPANPDLEGPIAQQIPGEPAANIPLHMASNRAASVPGSTAGDFGDAPLINGRPSGPAASAPAEPSEIPRKVVNTRAFNLGYEIDEVGPSGVGSVEFFISEDAGRQWYRYGSDADLKSPFRIDVPGEGNYGFQVRVRSGAGLVSEPPKAGEQPGVIVVVDETPPVATLEAPTQRTGGRAPAVQIRWSVQDANRLAEKAVDLDYGTSPDGPWTPIAKELDDQGGYVWEVTQLTAAQLFVRLTARDAAGNVSHAVTAEPVTVDLTLPTARITDIEVEPIP